ncbi:pyrroline-5-carboxylate reductase [Chelativorans sp. J32]|uniref:pyrroline-5-carboxylate reductase n=1 Tax=Chelativorans sp. J32 TaxID=935840 RepID=UPI000483A547|nr:pyrroline-5-carboxylate reductase [Chelativorans sp. J32]
MSKRVVLVGCGNMGYAMLKGWLAAGKLSASEISVVEPNSDLRARAEGHGVSAAAEPGSLGLTEADLIIFAVKPQMIRDVVPNYRSFAPDATFLSVAAGTAMATFEELLGSEAAVIRCMPNTPAAIGKGMLVVFSNRNVRAEVKAFVNDLLTANGAVAGVEDERLMDAVTAVSGSGPAYVFHFIECLTAAGEKAGLPGETAKLLAMQTVYGAAVLAKESGEEPGKLREQVTSPNGTTAAALAILMGEERLQTLVTEAVDAARQRSIELGK